MPPKEANCSILGGYCSHAFDCKDCPVFSKWADEICNNGWLLTWECIECLKASKNVERFLPGFFQSGRGPDNALLSIVKEFDNTDEDMPSLTGCQKCGFQSSFLQAVFRRQHG